MKHNILLVDNDPVFVDNCAEYLESQGFKVFTAGSPAEARAKLDDLWLHLAIVDVRLTDEDNPKDKSGLQLAQDMACILPTLLLTRHDNPEETMHEALMVQPDGRQRIMDYVHKRAEYHELSQSIQKILNLDKNFNAKLKIEWNRCDRFGLISLMEPDLDPNSLANRSEELEDLFRKLFKQASIRLQCKLWDSPGRIALAVFTFDDSSTPESYLVTCGQKSRIQAEAQRFAEFSPKGNPLAGTTLIESTNTIHYAANVYSLSGNDLENGFNLGELYLRETEKSFHVAMENLFNQRLFAWHQNKRVHLKKTTPNNILEQTIKSIREVDFTARANVIEDLTPTIGLKIKRESGRLLVKTGSQGLSYPEPLSAILKLINEESLDLAIKLPGNIHGDSILVDASGQVWLTDFAEAGLAPVGWNHANLEAAIRFDWLDMPDLHRRFELESSLLRSDFANPDARDLDAACRKAVHAISVVRKLYAQDPKNDIPGYQYLVFIQAVQRLVKFDPASPLTSNEIARMGQILLALAMIPAGLEKMEGNADQPVSTELKLIDKAARVFQVGERQVDIPAQPFNLLVYLYEHPNQVCSRDELVKNVLAGQEYEAGYLDTLAGRVRQALGEDAKHAKYLYTIPGSGYKLILKP